jgi:hypothetical protein
MPDTHGPNALFDFLESPGGEIYLHRIVSGKITFGEVIGIGKSFCISTDLLIRIASTFIPGFTYVYRP